MRKLTLPLLLSIATILPLLNSCKSTSALARSITVKSGEIPPDMQTENFTLIGVLHGHNWYDKDLKDGFANYTGEYVLATTKEINEKYSDLSKYRYILDYDAEGSSSLTAYSSAGGPGTLLQSSGGGYIYHIYDRKENKVYERKLGSTFISEEIKAYVIAIDAARKK